MVTDFLGTAYLWIKAFHVISVIAWMAGLFYLPRLFVYHAEVVGREGPGTNALFVTMERRLLRYIMRPAMMSSWVFGLMLVLTPGVVSWGMVWPWVKMVSVLGMTGFHFWLAARQRDFERGENTRNGRTYRLMNEVPTLFLVLIVIAVIVRF